MEEISFDNDTDISLHSEDGSDPNNNNEDADYNVGKVVASSSSCKKIKRTKRLGVSRTYGLRPRTQLRRPSYDCDPEDKDKEPGTSTRKAPRGKTRSPVAAKCRRLTANARERHRMKEINEAFSTLRGVLPNLQSRPTSRVSMTKIRTLRLAASYIQTLSDLLSGAESSDLTQEDQVYSQVNENGFMDPLQNFDDSGFKQTNPVDSKIFCNPSAVEDHLRNSFVQSVKQQDVSYMTQMEKDPQNHSWEEEMQASDEELFSLLEKEVLNMRNKQHHQPPTLESSNCGLPELNWGEDIMPMGCK